jgi:hypothetical protein
MATHLGVELTSEVRPPATDPTFGISVPAREAAAAPAHRLATVGDSLTHGFQHFAIFNTAMSWPAIVAYQLGARLRFPMYDGPGGHPLNLEWVARQLSGNPWESAVHIWQLMERVEQYYETGPGAAFPDPQGPTNENRRFGTCPDRAAAAQPHPDGGQQWSTGRGHGVEQRTQAERQSPHPVGGGPTTRR